MKSRKILIASTLLAVTLGSVASAQQRMVLQPNHPGPARFQLLREEGLVAPDGATFIPGTKMWTVADRATGTCFVWLFSPGGAAVTPIACPQ